jgi:hypothetical protein
MLRGHFFRKIQYVVCGKAKYEIFGVPWLWGVGPRHASFALLGKRRLHQALTRFWSLLVR